MNRFDNEFQTTPAAQQTEVARTVIPVVEETVRLGKRVVEADQVRISKHTTEHQQTVNVPLVHEEVAVERVTVNRYVDLAPEVRYEGETMIVPVMREVVEKRLVLAEELRITKRQVQTNAQETVTLRREEVEVHRASEASQASTAASQTAADDITRTKI